MALAVRNNADSLFSVDQGLHTVESWRQSTRISPQTFGAGANTVDHESCRHRQKRVPETLDAE